MKSRRRTAGLARLSAVVIAVVIVAMLRTAEKRRKSLTTEGRRGVGWWMVKSCGAAFWGSNAAELLYRALNLTRVRKHRRLLVGAAGTQANGMR